MNIREGMRRLGILLGVSGAILGGFAEYSNARAMWNARAAHRRFQSLMALPTMQKVAKSLPTDSSKRGLHIVKSDPLTVDPSQVNKLPPDPWAGGLPAPPVAPSTAAADPYAAYQDPPFGASNVKAPPVGQTLGGGGNGKNAADPYAEFQAPALPQDPDSKDWERTTGGYVLGYANPLLQGNQDGIKVVSFDAAGFVDSIKLSTGESIQKTEAPHPSAYLFVLLYPVLGFLLPWGAVSLFTWVVSGFLEPTR